MLLQRLVLRRGLLLFGPVLLLSGCGGGEATLSGRIMASGEPAGGASLEVQSMADAARRGSGAVLADGAYRIDFGTKQGLPPGDCRIEIRHTVTPDGKPLPPGEDGMAMRQSGRVKNIHVAFVRSLSSGTNQIDLELDEGEPIAASDRP